MATLKTTFLEEITLHGDDQRILTTKSYGGIGEFSRRVLTITTTEAVIATFSAAAASAGHYIAADVRYMRFTNLDSTNFITLTFRNQDNDEVAIKLDFGQSLLFNGDNANGMTAVFNATHDADAASDTAFGSLTNIQADANQDSCDLEMIIASV